MNFDRELRPHLAPARRSALPAFFLLLPLGVVVGVVGWIGGWFTSAAAVVNVEGPR